MRIIKNSDDTIHPNVCQYDCKHAHTQMIVCTEKLPRVFISLFLFFLWRFSCTLFWFSKLY